jgi:hypothetical protein
VKKNTLTTHQYGEFIEMAEPAWLISVGRTACAEHISWHPALGKVLNFFPAEKGIQPDHGDTAQVVYWVVPGGGGHYAKFCTQHPKAVIHAAHMPYFETNFSDALSARLSNSFVGQRS